MRLSAKAGYAVKAMFELGRNYDSGQPVSVEVIAERQAIPRKFLVQILIRLGQAGIARSVRGAGGGYRLALPPAQISMLEIFSAVDRAVAEGDDLSVSGPADEALRLLWKGVNQGITERLSVSLEQFLASPPGSPLNYQI